MTEDVIEISMEQCAMYEMQRMGLPIDIPKALQLDEKTLKLLYSQTPSDLIH